MYDGLLLDVSGLASQGQPGKVVIVVTDGNETSSHARLGDVVAAARKAHVSVYVIAIQSRSFSPGTLKTLATHTGGKYYAAASAGYLQNIYAAIANELARTWQIEYETAARPGDHVAISATVPGQGVARASTLISGKPTQPSKSSLPKSAYGTAGCFSSASSPACSSCWRSGCCSGRAVARRCAAGSSPTSRRSRRRRSSASVNGREPYGASSRRPSTFSASRSNGRPSLGCSSVVTSPSRRSSSPT